MLIVGFVIFAFVFAVGASYQQKGKGNQNPTRAAATKICKLQGYDSIGNMYIKQKKKQIILACK